MHKNHDITQMQSQLDMCPRSEHGWLWIWAWWSQMSCCRWTSSLRTPKSNLFSCKNIKSILNLPQAAIWRACCGAWEMAFCSKGAFGHFNLSSKVIKPSEHWKVPQDLNRRCRSWTSIPNKTNQKWFGKQSKKYCSAFLTPPLLCFPRKISLGNPSDALPHS